MTITTVGYDLDPKTFLGKYYLQKIFVMDMGMGSSLGTNTKIPNFEL